MDHPKTIARLQSLLAPLVIVVGLTLSYVLSVGPAIALCANYHITRETLRTAYAPLIWLANNNRACENALVWYGFKWHDCAPYLLFA